MYVILILEHYSRFSDSFQYDIRPSICV